MPAALIGAFAAAGNHSMMIETKSAGTITGIRLGNTGAQQNLPRLAAQLRRSRSATAPNCRPQDRRHRVGEITYSAACFCARLASIWSSADTTASKVSMVEAWRAL